MNYLIKAVALASVFVTPVAWGQEAQAAFHYGKMTMIERAVESPKVTVVYSDTSGVVEIRYQQCDECGYKTLLPAEGVNFSVSNEMLLASTAAQAYKDSPGTVFFNTRTSKVNRIVYFETQSGGDE